MKVIDFKEPKQLEDRGFTVKQALEDAKNADDVIISFVENGKIYTTYSTEEGNLAKLVGMLEISKTMILED